MDKLVEMLNIFTVPRAFKELLFFITGLGFIFYLHYNRVFNFTEKFSIQSLGRIENDALFLLLIYLISKLLFIIGQLIIAVFNFLILAKFKNMSFKKILQYLRYKEYTITVSLADLDKEVTIDEYHNVLTTHQYITDRIESKILFGILISQLFTSCLVFSFLISWIYIIPFFILFGIFISNDRQLTLNTMEIKKAAMKNKGNNPIA